MTTNDGDHTAGGAAAPTVADAVDVIAAARAAETGERRAVVTKWLALLDLADQRATMALDGVDRDTWLQVDLGLLRTEAQQVGRLGQARRTMPLVWSRFTDLTISFAQLRHIAASCSTVPADRIAVADLAVAARIDVADRECASAIIDDVELIAHELGPDNDERRERRRELGSRLSFSPDLFGGGTMIGVFDTKDFALAVEAIDRAVTTQHTLDRGALLPTGHTDHDEARQANKLTIDQARGQAFIGLLARRVDGDPATPALNLTVTTTLDALAGISDQPAMLLANITGGRLMASAKTIRRWTESHDATVRLIVLDEQGHDVLGAGDATRFSRGWLDEIVRSRHAASTFPGSRVAQNVCDVDHATDHAAGNTHVDNLAPVDRSRHSQKTRGCWSVTQRRDGSRVWKHTKTGWTAESAPPGAKIDLAEHRAERRKRRRP